MKQFSSLFYTWGNQVHGDYACPVKTFLKAERPNPDFSNTGAHFLTQRFSSSILLKKHDTVMVLSGKFIFYPHLYSVFHHGELFFQKISRDKNMSSALATSHSNLSRLFVQPWGWHFRRAWLCRACGLKFLMEDPCICLSWLSPGPEFPWSLTLQGPPPPPAVERAVPPLPATSLGFISW